MSNTRSQSRIRRFPFGTFVLIFMFYLICKTAGR